MLVLLITQTTIYRYKIIFFIQKNESVFLKSNTRTKNIKKIKYDLNNIFLSNLDLGGLRKYTNNIIIDQKNKRIDHPDKRAI